MSGHKYCQTDDYNFATTLISQDDHLTAGVWVTCGMSSDKLSFFLSIKVKKCDIFVRLKVMLSFCCKNLPLGTQRVPSQPTHVTHVRVLENNVTDQGAVHKE